MSPTSGGRSGAVKPAAGRAQVDAYLAALDPIMRAALKRLRSAIKSIVPKAEECISYGVPAFRYDGRVLVGYGAATNHCTFFPMSGTTVAAHEADLVKFDTSKGAIRFRPDRPLSAALLRKLVKARLRENAARRAATAAAAQRRESRPPRS